MRLSHLLATASAATLLASCGIGAPGYPEFGESAYVMSGSAQPTDGAPAVSTTIYRDGAKMRVETTIASSGPVSIVYDDNTGAAYIITAATAPSTVTPAPAAATPAAPGAASTTPAVVPVPTPVGGTAVKIDDSAAPTPIEDAWIKLGADNARTTGPCTVAGEAGHKWTPRESTSGVARVACITEDGIVLEVTEGATVVWRATSVTRGPQDIALFGVPAGYQVIDPKGVAETVGEAIQDVGQVSGDPKTPAATTPAPAPTIPKT